MLSFAGRTKIIRTRLICAVVVAPSLFPTPRLVRRRRHRRRVLRLRLRAGRSADPRSGSAIKERRYGGWTRNEPNF